jgi:hypothetical protein
MNTHGDHLWLNEQKAISVAVLIIDLSVIDHNKVSVASLSW